MKSLHLFLAELAKIKEKKGVLISVIAVLLIPVVYAAIILSPRWGPYDHLDNLPVAVVNEDKGAASGEEQINVGNDLVTDLKKSNSLGWDFVSKEEAKQGLKDMKYYLVIEIPENFSQNITTVLDSSPKKAELKFTQNEGLHFMAAQVTNNAMNQLREQLANQVTETYAKNIFSQLGGVANGFKEAADGSEQIYNGSTKLKDGTSQILTSLNEKSDDIGTLAEGSKELKAGTGELLSNITSKQGDIAKLAAGSTELKGGTGEMLENLKEKSNSISQLANGAKSLEKGAKGLSSGSDQVLDGLKRAQVGSSQINGGLSQLAPGTKSLADGTGNAEEGAKQLAALANGINDGIAQLANHPLLKDNPDVKKLLAYSAQLSSGMDNLSTNMTSLKDGAKKIDGGIQQLAPGAQTLDAGIKDLVIGQTQLNDGAKQLAKGASQVSSGNATVETGWKSLTAGAAKLYTGSTQVSEGNQSVNNGWKQLSAGASKIDDGMGQVSYGNQSVRVGWSTLTDGVKQVDHGLFDLKTGSNELASGLKDGAEQTSQLKPNEDNMTMFATPVEFKGDVIHKYPFYRDSNAPYILSLALFVGIIIMSFVVEFQKPALLPASSFSWFSGKLMNLALLAIVQGIIISLFSLIFLKLEVESALLFVLFSIGVSLTFLMIVFFFVTIGGNIGRFIMLAFIVLQLSTTGSSLPIEMLPENLRQLSTYLPLTYSIEGFRNIITLGNFSIVWSNIAVLIGYLVISAILAYIVFIFKFKRQSPKTE
ncbi:YhgE/Pip family protein [Cytobacillus sp. Hz8]|uniref:YhgE/Pip family protein n=1 Tax=Cytobacillus sp. Hz8 TaxID=3347168 RepID=UPI0035DFF98D